MSDITVASTTDPQADIDRAAGVEVKEQPPKPVEGEDIEKLEQQQAEQATPEEKKAKSSYQKRIDKLVKERETWKGKAEEFESRLAALEQGKNGTPEQTEVTEQAAPAQEQPTERPQRHNFASDEEFVEAVADWKVDQKLQKIQQQNAEAAQRQAEQDAYNQMRQTYEDRVDKARERYEDFDDIAYKPNVQVYGGVLDIIQQHENGPDLQYYLAKNPKVASDLAKMSPQMAMARAGAIADQLGQEETPATEEARPVSKKSAPAPIRPVSGSSTKSSVPLDELEYQEFRRIRDLQEKNRYRR